MLRVCNCVRIGHGGRPGCSPSSLSLQHSGAATLETGIRMQVAELPRVVPLAARVRRDPAARPPMEERLQAQAARRRRAAVRAAQAGARQVTAVQAQVALRALAAARLLAPARPAALAACWARTAAPRAAEQAAEEFRTPAAQQAQRVILPGAEPAVPVARVAAPQERRAVLQRAPFQAVSRFARTRRAPPTAAILTSSGRKAAARAA